MRRVSSRQRLVSWDAFDATANDFPAEATSSSDEEEGWNHETATATPLPLTMTGRKRERSKHKINNKNKQSPVAIPATLTSSVPNHHHVPAFPWELAFVQPQLPMDQVPEDVYLYMCSFLDLSSIRSVMALNHKFRQLLLSADSFWMSKCHKLWEGLMLPSLHSNHKLKLVDSCQIPRVVTGNNNQDCNMTVNLPLLISMTPAKLPTKVDETLLGTCRRVHRTIIRRQHLQIIERTLTPNELEPPAELLVVTTCNGKRSIQYTGRVGSGDRCIRSNHPMPRPTKRIDSSKQKQRQHRFSLSKQNGKQHHSSSLFDLFCRGAGSHKHAICGTPLLELERPFCAPYVQQDGCSLQVGPRMVAYFEVSILAATAGSFSQAAGPRDCVAVGVATESFSCQTRMPGWDAQSFGYHGDDGGIFHASGAMLERFGPCFGTGDTVGCGIDYVARGIFFTLNGVFLGYGWKRIDSEFLENNLYGVVGIDTNDPVSVNYGDAPFQFDLGKFTSKHNRLIAHQYQHHSSLKNKKKQQQQVTEDTDASELAALPSYPEI